MIDYLYDSYSQRFINLSKNVNQGEKKDQKSHIGTITDLNTSVVNLPNASNIKPSEKSLITHKKQRSVCNEMSGYSNKIDNMNIIEKYVNMNNNQSSSIKRDSFLETGTSIMDKYNKKNVDDQNKISYRQSELSVKSNNMHLDRSRENSIIIKRVDQSQERTKAHINNNSKIQSCVVLNDNVNNVRKSFGKFVSDIDLNTIVKEGSVSIIPSGGGDIRHWMNSEANIIENKRSSYAGDVGNNTHVKEYQKRRLNTHSNFHSEITNTKNFVVNTNLSGALDLPETYLSSKKDTNQNFTTDQNILKKNNQFDEYCHTLDTNTLRNNYAQTIDNFYNKVTVQKVNEKLGLNENRSLNNSFTNFIEVKKYKEVNIFFK